MKIRDVAGFFQLNTTIESNSQMSYTFFGIQVQSYHSLVY